MCRIWGGLSPRPGTAPGHKAADGRVPGAGPHEPRRLGPPRTATAPDHRPSALDPGRFGVVRPGAVFEGPEWQERLRRLEEESERIGREVGEYFSSPEWQRRVEEIAEQGAQIGKETEAYFNSPEFRERIKRIEENSQRLGEEIGEYFRGPEWKEQMRRIQEMVDNLVRGLERIEIEVKP